MGSEPPHRAALHEAQMMLEGTILIFMYFCFFPPFFVQGGDVLAPFYLLSTMQSHGAGAGHKKCWLSFALRLLFGLETSRFARLEECGSFPPPLCPALNFSNKMFLSQCQGKTLRVCCFWWRFAGNRGFGPLGFACLGHGGECFPWGK